MLEGTMITLKIRLLALLLGICIDSCQSYVNLKWTTDNGVFTLKCKTSSLIWSVQFYCNDNKEIAYCQIPFPYPQCYTSYSSYTVYQDTSTNTTILTHVGIDSSLNGQWKCIYGRNVDVDTVNVTLSIQDTSMDYYKNENCSEEFYAWTMFGFTLVIVAILLFNTASRLGWKPTGRSLLSDKPIINCFPNYKNFKGRVSIVSVLIVCVAVLPVFIGSFFKDCKYKEIFIIYGIFKAVILLIFSYNLTIKRIMSDETLENDHRNQEIDIIINED